MTEKEPIVVLIAEDDEDDFLLTRDAFREAGLDTDLRWVRDGEELLDYLHRRQQYGDPASSPRPTLILLDLNMPRKDGREALKEIKSDPRFRAIPVLAMTTSNAKEDIQYTYGLGVNSFIRKPVGFNRFVDVVKAIDHYWFNVVKLPTNGGA
ncbi:MAG TPA: response regulator [Candidatus Eisenbacteria bacterium]|jgi:CheY-like chemotaxis protein|nr:response regulator [Candidatus Eisenbacteria bacterium]